MVIRYNSLIPIIQASEVKARNTESTLHTALGWEINPESFYRVLKRFWSYEGIKEIIVTENGAAIQVIRSCNSEIRDEERIDYFKHI